MSGIAIQQAALDKVNELKLDHHEHDHHRFALTSLKTWTCNWENGDAVKLSAPKKCELKNIVLR